MPENNQNGPEWENELFPPLVDIPPDRDYCYGCHQYAINPISGKCTNCLECNSCDYRFLISEFTTKTITTCTGRQYDVSVHLACNATRCPSCRSIIRGERTNWQCSIMCGACGMWRPTHESTRVILSGYGRSAVCRTCLPLLVRCHDCLGYHSSSTFCGNCNYRHDCGAIIARHAVCSYCPVCPDCEENVEYIGCEHDGCFNYCHHCDEYYNSRQNDDCPNCPSCSNCGLLLDDNFCERCNEGSTYAQNGAARINPYYYKPEPEFHGNGPVFMGFELEVTTPLHLIQRCANIAQDALGDLAYLKKDGSISHGFEIVTHPMSYEYFMSNFPFDMLRDLSDMGATTPENNGLHVHVSRKAFKSPSHAYRWLKFMYRNETDICKIARRISQEWAAFGHHDRDSIKYRCKSPGGDRYTAVNCANRTTYEVRVFQSTLDKTELMASVGLVDASVKYTKNLTISEIVRNDGWSTKSLQKWLDSSYLPLQHELSK